MLFLPCLTIFHQENMQKIKMLFLCWMLYMSDIRVKKCYPNICTLMPYDLFDLQIQNQIPGNVFIKCTKWMRVIFSPFAATFFFEFFCLISAYFFSLFPPWCLSQFFFIVFLFIRKRNVCSFYYLFVWFVPFMLRIIVW